MEIAFRAVQARATGTGPKKHFPQKGIPNQAKATPHPQAAELGKKMHDRKPGFITLAFQFLGEAYHYEGL